jgi:hypothetical protein
MHPTMMKLLGDARIQDLSHEIDRTVRPRGSALRRYRRSDWHRLGRS